MTEEKKLQIKGLNAIEWVAIVQQIRYLKSHGYTWLQIYTRLKELYPNRRGLSLDNIKERYFQFTKETSLFSQADITDSLLDEFKVRFYEGIQGAKAEEDWSTYLKANLDHAKFMQSIGILPIRKEGEEDLSMMSKFFEGVYKEVQRRELEKRKQLITGAVDKDSQGT